MSLGEEKSGREEVVVGPVGGGGGHFLVCTVHAPPQVCAWVLLPQPATAPSCNIQACAMRDASWLGSLHALILLIIPAKAARDSDAHVPTKRQLAGLGRPERLVSLA